MCVIELPCQSTQTAFRSLWWREPMTLHVALPSIPGNGRP
jgi:hypothetical protein